MNNIKSNNIIESLNDNRYITYKFPDDSEAKEFCRDNNIPTYEIEWDGEYFLVDVPDKSNKKDNKTKNTNKKKRTEYTISFKAMDKRDDDVKYSDKIDKVPAYSEKQAIAYLKKIYREKGYVIRDLKVDGTRILDNVGFIDRKNIEV